MSSTEYSVEIPIGYGKSRFVIETVQKRTKSLVYVHPGLVNELLSNLKAAGVPTFTFYRKLGQKEQVIRDFHAASSGVLVTTIHHNFGYRLEGVSLVVFVELHLVRNSNVLVQAIARARHHHVTALFMNCQMKRALLPPRLVAESDPNKHHARKIVRRDRKPFVYKSKDHYWRVQIGKWNNTFGSYEEARRFAVSHYVRSTEQNWQGPRFDKSPAPLKPPAKSLLTGVRKVVNFFVSALADGHQLTTIEEIRPQKTR